MKCKLPHIPELLAYERCLSRGETSCVKNRSRARKALRRRFVYLGSGWSREVFAINDDCVLKFSGLYINNMELDFWNKIKQNKEASTFFAPIEFGSKSGGFLLMHRSERKPTVEEFEKFRDDFYLFFGFNCTDSVFENVGIIDGKPVLIDYSDCYLDFKKRNK